MSLLLFIPIVLGAFSIIQAGLNKQIGNHVGFTHMTLVANAITVAFCVLFYLLVKLKPQYFGPEFHVRLPLNTLKWWYFIPPFFGFCLVMGLPYAFGKLGAVEVTVTLVAAQMVTSALWDIFIEQIPLSSTKLVGMLLAGLSVYLVTGK